MYGRSCLQGCFRYPFSSPTTRCPTSPKIHREEMEHNLWVGWSAPRLVFLPFPLSIALSGLDVLEDIIKPGAKDGGPSSPANHPLQIPNRRDCQQTRRCLLPSTKLLKISESQRTQRSNFRGIILPSAAS